jgi:DNA-binding LacI/PurR family transcriptional regulator
VTKKPTLKDVASEAQVSTATVARVLHGRGFVSKDSRRQVEDAIKKTGYRLNILAQSLRRQRTKTIGHLLTSISPNPFFAGVELGVENEAIRNGYSVLIWNVFEDPKREALGVETFVQRQVDAIIFTTPIEPKNVEMALSAQIPVIQVERPTRVHSHKVLVDNYAGAASAVEHLISLGHKRIGYIGGNPRNYPTNLSIDEQRLAGYRDTLRKFQITPSNKWYAAGKYYSVEDGYKIMDKFLKDGEVTAVLAACDILAAGALQAIYDHRLRVPEDISVVGFDDTYAPYLSPPLTTVRQPMFEIGQMAARIAIEALNGHPGELLSNDFRVESLSTQLTIRSSTSRPGQ